MISYRFLSDSPARQFEAGQKKGGNNFCHICPINGQYAWKYTHVCNLPILSLQDRVNKIVKTPASLSKPNQNKTNLYNKIKKHETVEELRQRNAKFLNTLPAMELQSFDFEMHGIQRPIYYLPCCLDKAISVSSLSISTLMNTNSWASPWFYELYLKFVQRITTPSP